MTRAEWKGLRELQAAIRRNPTYTKQRAQTFITRGLAEYRRVIYRNPWRMGTYSVSGGGGAPVDTRNLRDTHVTRVSGLEGSIGPNLQAAPYARAVHEGTRFMHKRPWLDYAKKTAAPYIRTHEKELLRDIVKQLAS